MQCMGGCTIQESKQSVLMAFGAGRQCSQKFSDCLAWLNEINEYIHYAELFVFTILVLLNFTK